VVRERWVSRESIVGNGGGERDEDYYAINPGISNQKNKNKRTRDRNRNRTIE
jgi:hypothetical protein